MKKRLVIAGGGHAHMMTLASLHQFVDNGCDVTVIGPSEHHYYSGMGPGMLGRTYTPAQIRFATRHLVEKKGGRFVRAKVTQIDPENQRVHLDSGAALPYDLLSCNLGSQVPAGMIRNGYKDIYLVKPIERLMEAQQRILTLGVQQALTIGIIGGGPSAVEIAGNIWRLAQAPGMKPLRIRILTSQKMMPDHPPGVRRKAMASLLRRKIEIVENCRAARIETGLVTDDAGKSHKLDLIFVAIGVVPSAVFEASGIPTGPDGGMRVNKYLQSTAFPNIFGGGDCIHFEDSPLDKVGVYAVRQNPVLLHNLNAFLEDSAFEPFVPGGKYLLIFNLGDGSGIFYKWRLLFGGRLAFAFKDYLDRSFMRKFQSLE